MNKNALSAGFTSNEIEFLAEESMIEIVPNFRMDTIECINDDYGPFRPQFPAKVPLWLAIQLKKYKKCNIRPPEWMKPSMLKDQLEQEQNEEKYFKEIPYHFLEISSLILTHASDDVPGADKVRTLIADITDVRACKIRAVLEELTTETVFKLNNISAMELNTIRSFSLGSLDTFKQLRDADSSGAGGVGGESQQTQMTQDNDASSGGALRRTRRLDR